MVISLVQSNTEDTPVSSLSFNMGSNFTAGNTAFFLASYWDDGGEITAVSFGGTAGTRDIQSLNGDGSKVEVWRASNLAGGSAAVSITSGGSWGGNYMDSRVLEFSGIATSSPIDKTPAQNTGSTANPGPNTTGTLTKADELAFTLLGHGAAGSAMTEPSGWTRGINIDDYVGSSSGACAYLITSATTALVPTWTSGAVAWRCGTITYLGAGPGSPTIDTQPQSQSKYIGDTATFTVSATTSGGTLHYQWKKNGSNVGTDSSSYTTGANDYSNNGDVYTVDVTDDNGTRTSNGAVLTIVFSILAGWFSA